MNTGVWIFLTVVLLLLVLHPGFRRFATWAACICTVVAAIGMFVWWLHSRNQSAAIGPPLVRADASAVAACPSGSTNPGCPVPLEDQPDISDLPAPPPGYTLDCPPGQKAAKDNITGAVSCYNPHDPAQLKEHLAECSHKGDPEWMKHDLVIADRRGIPCRT